MSTLREEIESLRRRIANTKCTQTKGRLQGQLEGLRQRELNHENMQIEIAKHLGWIQQTGVSDAV